MSISRIVPAFILILLSVTLVSAKVRTDYDHSANFYNYKTFMWLEKPQTEDPFMQKRIFDSVNNHLLIKGLEPVSSGADLGVRVSTSTEEKQTYYTYYNGMGWGAGWGPGWGYGWGGGGPGWATTTVETYLEGTTVVDLVDTATDKVVWRSVSVGTISDKPEKATKKTQKNIGKMFKNYPPGRDN